MNNFIKMKFHFSPFVKGGQRGIFSPFKKGGEGGFGQGRFVRS